jgi:hypothetical protein
VIHRSCDPSLRSCRSSRAAGGRAASKRHVAKAQARVSDLAMATALERGLRLGLTASVVPPNQATLGGALPSRAVLYDARFARRAAPPNPLQAWMIMSTMPCSMMCGRARTPIVACVRGLKVPCPEAPMRACATAAAPRLRSAARARWNNVSHVLSGLRCHVLFVCRCRSLAAQTWQAPPTSWIASYGPPPASLATTASRRWFG